MITDCHSVLYGTPDLPVAARHDPPWAPGFRHQSDTSASSGRPGIENPSPGFRLEELVGWSISPGRTARNLISGARAKEIKPAEQNPWTNAPPFKFYGYEFGHEGAAILGTLETCR